MNNQPQPQSKYIPPDRVIRFRIPDEDSEKIGKVINQGNFYEILIKDQEDPVIVVWEEILSIDEVPRDEWLDSQTP